MFSCLSTVREWRQGLVLGGSQEYATMYSEIPLVRPPFFFSPEMWPFKRVGLSSGRNQYIYVLIYIIMWLFQRGWHLVRVSKVVSVYVSNL